MIAAAIPGAVGVIFMNEAEVKERLAAALKESTEFDNAHGITPGNIRSFLVKPYKVSVDAEDGDGSKSREMWIVLTEARDPQRGYVVVLDPSNGQWGVAEYAAEKDSWILVGANDSLAGVLSAM